MIPQGMELSQADKYARDAARNPNRVYERRLMRPGEVAVEQTIAVISPLEYHRAAANAKEAALKMQETGSDLRIEMIREGMLTGRHSES